MVSDFKKLVSARFLFTLAVQMQAVVVGWRVYDLTQDPLSLGFVGLAEAIPALSLALYAGYIVDRHRPLDIYQRVLCGSLLSAAVVLFSQVFQNQLPMSFQLSALYIASIITGTSRAFSQPSIFSAVPRMIPRAELAKSSAWMASAMQTARIAGPAAGGILFGFLGETVAFSAICVCLLLGIAAMAWIQIKIDPPEFQKAPESLKKELMSGASFVFKHPILLPAMSLDMISVLFGGVTALLPIFAKEILMIGPKGLGLLRAAPAAGAVLTSFFLTRFQLKKNAGRWLLSAVAGFGCCILVFAASRNYLLSLMALGLSGAFDSVSAIIRNTAVQMSSPDHLRGRVSAINSMFIGSSNELGEFESGVAAKLLGAVNATYLGGIICLLVVGTIALKSPTLREMDLEKI